MIPVDRLVVDMEKREVDYTGLAVVNATVKAYELAYGLHAEAPKNRMKDKSIHIENEDLDYAGTSSVRRWTS